MMAMLIGKSLFAGGARRNPDKNDDTHGRTTSLAGLLNVISLIPAEGPLRATRRRAA